MTANDPNSLSPSIL